MRKTFLFLLANSTKEVYTCNFCKIFVKRTEFAELDNFPRLNPMPPI